MRQTPEQIDVSVRAQLRAQQRKMVRALAPATREEAIELFRLPMQDLVKKVYEQKWGVANATK